MYHAVYWSVLLVLRDDGGAVYGLGGAQEPSGEVGEGLPTGGHRGVMFVLHLLGRR